MRSWTIGKQLYVAFGLSTAITAVLAASSLRTTAQLNTGVEEPTDVTAEVLYLAGQHRLSAMVDGAGAANAPKSPAAGSPRPRASAPGRVLAMTRPSAAAPATAADESAPATGTYGRL